MKPWKDTEEPWMHIATGKKLIGKGSRLDGSNCISGKRITMEAVKRLVSSLIKKILVSPQEFDNEVGMCMCFKK